jgi:catalase
MFLKIVKYLLIRLSGNIDIMTSSSTATLKAPVQPQQTLPPKPAEMVDALNRTFGKHPGKRASHAKGFFATGEFTPELGICDFLNCSMFRQGKLPATLRFSVGGGNPAVSDKSRSVRGMGLRLNGIDQTYDLVLISEPAFFAATPASFVSFLQARVADPTTGKPDPLKIAAHNAAYPDGMRQPALVAAHAAPASYATTPYFSNNAFRFTNDKALTRHARVLMEPSAGTHYLSEEDEKSLPDNFLEDELTNRIARGAIEFTLYAQLPAAGDSLIDPSTVWTGTEKVALGKLRVARVVTDQSRDGLVFVPGTLPDGICPSDDPILQSRAAAYAVSLARRK